MNRDDLGSATWNHYLLQCASPHTVLVSVSLETPEGVELVSFDEGRGGERGVRVTGGEVQVDADTPAGRVLTLMVLDKDKELLTAETARLWSPSAPGLSATRLLAQ